MTVRALGNIVESCGGKFSRFELYTGLLDYYDHYTAVDPDMSGVHPYLSPMAADLGNDLVNMATHAHILWGAVEEISENAASVLVASAIAEAFFISLRCAYDAIGSAVAFGISNKKGQVPGDGLHAILTWSKKNPGRVRDSFKPIVFDAFDEFYFFRGLRDKIAHRGVGPVVHTDGRQFNLWLHSLSDGWILREPLFPLLKRGVSDLLLVSDRVAQTLNTEIRMPARRVRSRVVSGVFVPDLHKLVEQADQYSSPSP